MKTSVYAAALSLLARREHGAAELKSKLCQKGHAPEEVEEVLQECQRLGLQSDTRFVESYCRVRSSSGFGPIRIRQELKQRHIDDALLNIVLKELAVDWTFIAHKAWSKKYKNSGDVSYHIKQKQKQFLLYRGFPVDVIEALFVHHDG